MFHSQVSLASDHLTHFFLVQPPLQLWQTVSESRPTIRKSIMQSESRTCSSLESSWPNVDESYSGEAFDSTNIESQAGYTFQAHGIAIEHQKPENEPIGLRNSDYTPFAAGREPELGMDFSFLNSTDSWLAGNILPNSAIDQGDNWMLDDVLGEPFLTPTFSSTLDSPGSSLDVFFPGLVSQSEGAAKLKESDPNDTWVFGKSEPWFDFEWPAQDLSAERRSDTVSISGQIKRTQSLPPFSNSGRGIHPLSKFSKGSKKPIDFVKTSKLNIEGMKRHSCPQCELKFRYPKDLARHIGTVHVRREQQRLLCPDHNCKFATQGFFRKDKWLSHWKTHANKSHFSSENDLRIPMNGSKVRSQSGGSQGLEPVNRKRLGLKRSLSVDSWWNGKVSLGITKKGAQSNSALTSVDLVSRPKIPDTAWSDKFKLESVDTVKEAIQNHKCPVPGCGSEFPLLSNLRRHEKSVHNENEAKKGYVCPVESCGKVGKSWNRLDNFKQHLSKLHGDIDMEILLKRSEVLSRSDDPFIVTTPNSQLPKKRPADGEISTQSGSKFRQLQNPALNIMPDSRDLEAANLVQEASDKPGNLEPGVASYQFEMDTTSLRERRTCTWPMDSGF